MRAVGCGSGRVVQTEQRGRFDAIRDQLRASGRRWTVAKGAIVEVLLTDGGHLSAHQVHEQVAARYPQIDRSTVHRVLLMLADARVIHALDQRGEARYGLADQPHHHAVCTICGCTAEVPMNTIQPILKTIATRTGFRFGDESITVAGQCPTCAAAR